MIDSNETYDLIKKSQLFDYDYYNKVYNLNFDNFNQSLNHYLKIGYKKGYNPNEYFNGNEYLNTHPDLKNTDANPLIHYLKIKYRKERENTPYHKTRILFVLHHSGGVEYSTQDIANSVSDEYESFILQSDMNTLILYQLIGNELRIIDEFELSQPWHAKLIHSREYSQIYYKILFNHNIDIIEIEHLLFHSLDLPYISKRLNIPTILKIHDYYFICPVFVLLDENYKYCEGKCDNKEKNCGKIVEWFNLPQNIVDWKEKWRKEMKRVFEKCDMIVTSMPFTKNMFLSQYPSLNENDIQLLEPGIDLKRYGNLNSPPTTMDAIKILIPGTLLVHKGCEFIKELKKEDVENKLELHFLGYADEELERIGTFHGEYQREDFAKHVNKIKPSFIGLFSITPETYSYTLTESISVGVPVIVSNIGVLKERVKNNNCGWVIDTNKPKDAYQRILEIAHDKTGYEKVKTHIGELKIKTTDEMGNDYKKLYAKLLKMKHKE